MKRLLEFFLFLTLLSVVRSSKNHEIACIDDSDCVKLGHKYSCFLYYCHNWVDQDPLRPHCQADWQCGEEHKCFRHWNLREVDNGICLSNYQVKTCDVHSDCHEGDHCCGMYCCSQHYYKQWEEFACFSDMQCRSWKTGNYCCNNNLCCDDRKVEIQAFGIDTDLQTNEIPGVSYESVATEVPLTTTMHDLTKDSDTFGEDGAESQVNSVIVEPTATAAHDTIEITTPDSPEDTTLVDKTVIIKDTITVNVSSYDLYQTDDEEDTTIDTSITERVVGHTGINKDESETSILEVEESTNTDDIEMDVNTKKEFLEINPVDIQENITTKPIHPDQAIIEYAESEDNSGIHYIDDEHSSEENSSEESDLNNELDINDVHFDDDLSAERHDVENEITMKNDKTNKLDITNKNINNEVLLSEDGMFSNSDNIEEDFTTYENDVEITTLYGDGVNDIATNNDNIELNETSLSTHEEISSTNKITDEISVTTNDDETTTKNIPTDSTLHVSALMDSSEEDVEEDEDIITTPSTTTTTTTTTTNKPTTRRQIKQQRPKNKYVMPHRFPSSGSSLQSWCTSAIKSIVLMFIQLKMISNSFSSC